MSPRPTRDETSAVFTEASDVQSRRERLLQVKRKVEAAARPAPTMPALPETSARAGESALALVHDLEGQLDRARAVEVALKADLDQARAELGRGAADSRRTGERLAAMEQQVEEKRVVLKEMLGEMSALEEERDSAVGRAQALAALDEERQALLDGLSTRAEQAEKARADAEEELERLGAEFDERASDAARLRAALAQVTQERDDLARELAEARRELAELADARKALEQVHEALASARARLG
jgi:chromosome segregation ATPase